MTDSEPIDTRPIVREAVKIRGSQAKLARALGISQARVNQLCNEATPCSAEIAVGIERATEGVIPRWRSRPDLWDAPTADPPEGKAA